MAQDNVSYRRAAAPLLAMEEASAFHAQGRLREAEQRYQVVLAANDRHFDALYRLGLIRLTQGRFGEATKLFRRAIKVDRSSADVHHHLAVAFAGLQRHQEAIECLRTALALNPNFAEAHNNLAHSLYSLGRMDAAAAHYEKAIAIKPDYPEAHNNLGILFQAQGRSADAMVRYRTALAIRPGFSDAHKNLANLLGAAKLYHEALNHYEQAIAARSNDAQAHLALGNVLCELDRFYEAVIHYGKALAADPSCVEAHLGLGQVAYGRGSANEAIIHYRRALAIRPKDASAHGHLGEALQSLGQFEKAREAFERAVATSPTKAGAFWNLANSRRFAARDPCLAAMQALACRADSLSAQEQVDLYFALGKAFADLGEAAASFAHLERGNATKRRLLDYNEAATLGRLARVAVAFSAATMREKAGQGDPSQLPVFVVGMPRSGTSLVEQILASHPRVFGAGELRTMANLAERIAGPDGGTFPESVATLSGERLRALGGDYLSVVRRLAPHAERITDKMPGNFMLAGLIHLTLPKARIIHVRRDLRDTAVSCFSILFARGNEFAYDLAELGRYCAAYRRLMDHWHEVMPGIVLDVSYEDVIADLEGQARRIVEYCGLEWDAACLAFQSTARAVRTASAVQVRQPIYATSVGRWRVHEDRLRPLLESLG